MTSSIRKHKHHIIPRHAGGTDDPSNIVELTIRQHALAHKKLYKEHGRWQDKVAWLSLSKQITGAEATRLAQSYANKNKTPIVEIKTVRLPSTVLKKRFCVNKAYVLYFILPNLTPIGSANPSPIIAKHTTSNPISAQKIPKKISAVRAKEITIIMLA